jgi:hypothetical protein
MFARSKRAGALAALILSGVATIAVADAWKPIRSGAGSDGWKQVVCDRSGNGWRSCNMGLTITIQSNPGSVAAAGEQATLVATVTDYNGNNAGKDVQIDWTTTDGNLNAPSTITNDAGQTSVVLTSSHNIGSSTVTATSPAEGGTGQLTIPFTDKWVATSAVFSAWQNNGDPYSCSAWTPDPSTVEKGTTFTQSASCSQNQIAYQQNREVSLITGQIRNVGTPIALYQTVPVTINQQASGTKQSTPSCAWTSAQRHGIYATGWSHSVGTDGKSKTDFRLFMGDLEHIGDVPKITDTLVYKGTIYSVGRFRQTGCMGKNCATMRDEYEVCSTPQ